MPPTALGRRPASRLISLGRGASLLFGTACERKQRRLDDSVGVGGRCPCEPGRAMECLARQRRNIEALCAAAVAGDTNGFDTRT